METILPALLGFLAGVLGATITPLIQWNIEKRRQKLAYKRELIAEWRKAIAEVAITIAPDATFEEVLKVVTRNSAFYSFLPHWDVKSIDKLDDEDKELIKGAQLHVVIAAFMGDLERIEKEWGLL